MFFIYLTVPSLLFGKISLTLTKINSLLTLTKSRFPSRNWMRTIKFFVFLALCVSLIISLIFFLFFLKATKINPAVICVCGVWVCLLYVLFPYYVYVTFSCPSKFFQLWPVAHSCRYRLSIRRKGIYLSWFLHHQWIRCRKKTHGRGCSVMLSLTGQFVFKMGPHVQLILDKFPKRRYVVLFWNLSRISVTENVI